jgi:MFS family permease
LLIGAILTGIASGVGVPYLNTIAPIKGGRNSASTVMPLLSAALYMGQFLSPIIVTPLSRWLLGEQDVTGSFKIGIMFCLVFLIQVCTTRDYQNLPPREKE